MTAIGYARVSTDGQTLDAQQSALADAGCARVFSEKQSGAKTDRQQLAKAIAALAQGDTLIVTKLDRLAGSGILLGANLDPVRWSDARRGLAIVRTRPRSRGGRRQHVCIRVGRCPATTRHRTRLAHCFAKLARSHPIGRAGP